MNTRNERRTMNVLALFLLIPLLAFMAGCSDSGVGPGEEELPTGETDWKTDYKRMYGFIGDRIFIDGTKHNRIETLFKASNNGTREEVRIGNGETKQVDFSDAITEFRLIIEVKKEFLDPQRPEGFALRIGNGAVSHELTNYTVTEILGEGDPVDETTKFEFAVDPEEVFAAGPWYSVHAVHGTEVRGEDYTDGNDRYLFQDEVSSKKSKVWIKYKYDRRKYAIIKRQHQN